MRVGLIGYGAWGRCHASALLRIEGAKLAAVLCQGAASAAAAQAELPGVAVVRSLEALLALDLDAVDIVAPNHLHADLAVAALRAGRHVLLEKPLATTIEDCERIIATSRASGCLVSVTHEMRASPQWGRIRQEIAAGAIGRPRFASFTLFRHPFRAGSAGWRHDRARVGSWLLEEPVHFFDLLLWYFAESGAPVSLQAAGTADALAENITVTVRFSDGAAFVVTQMLGGFGHHCSMALSGSDGAVRTWWSADTARSTAPSFALEIRRGRAAPEAVAIAASGELIELEAQLATAIAGLREGRSALPPEEAMKSVRLCVAAEAACRSGQTLAL
jgi:myo-inositol 2-dehydrogenase/D-chiro-inositol 1-dehydrogenase